MVYQLHFPENVSADESFPRIGSFEHFVSMNKSKQIRLCHVFVFLHFELRALWHSNVL